MQRPAARSVLLALGLALATSAQGGEVYRWVDENGVVHYRVERDERPASQRNRLRDPGAAGAQTPRPSAPSTLAPSSAAPVAPGSAREAPAASPAGGEASPPAPPPGLPPLAEQELEPEAELPDRGSPDGASAPGTVSGDALPESAQQIAELEAQIDRDREMLKSLISEGQQHGRDVSEDPRIREIAERLPRLQSELDALRAEPAP